MYILNSLRVALPIHGFVVLYGRSTLVSTKLFTYVYLELELKHFVLQKFLCDVFFF